MNKVIKTDDSCTTAGKIEIPNSGDDANYPRDFYSDSFPENNKYEKSKVIKSFLDQLGYSREEIQSFCIGGCDAAGSECLPVGISCSSSNTIQLALKTMTLPNGDKRQMYWAFAKTRGNIKIKATCKCITTPI